MSARLTPCALAAALLLVAAPPALAQGGPTPGLLVDTESPAATPEQQAAAHFDKGVVFYKAGETAMALSEFEAAYAAAPRFEPLYNIAMAHQKLAHLVLAHRTFLRYLSEGGDRVPAKRRADVSQAIAALEGMLARLEVNAVGPPAVVELDGQVVGTTPMPPVLVEPGSHEVRVRNEAGAQATTVRELRAGESVALMLSPVVLAAPKPRFGVVAVETTPAGASLSLDFKPLGKAPWSGELETGRHVIEAELDGYLPQTFRLDLQGGEQRDLRLELSPRPWYRRWYVWAVVAGVLVAGAAATAAVVAVESKPDLNINLP
ncbi:MAG: PEGA domain-containing protein [Myxococcales bacterium]